MRNNWLRYLYGQRWHAAGLVVRDRVEGQEELATSKKPQPGLLQAGLFFGRSAIRYESGRPD